METRLTSAEPDVGPFPPGRLKYFAGFGSARIEAESKLSTDGVLLPTPQTANWLRGVGCNDSKLLITVDADGRAIAAVGVGIGRSRSLPGHVVYRVQRLGASREANAEVMLLGGLAQAARLDPRCIRLHIELFEPDPELRKRLGKTLQELGFVKAAETTAYAHTPSLDLSPSEDELFGKCASSARRNVRAPAKRGLRLSPLDDPSYADRLQALMNEVFERTGGTTRDLPWTTILEMSAASPERSRIIGLFAPNETGPAGLVAFSWGCVNGDYVTYEAGASTRTRDFGNLALAYAPLWDLIAWAKRIGASWFDFGGVPSPRASSASEDPLAGISDFKRFFCERVVEGGEDWILEPKPVRAFLARAVRAAATRVRA
jgi:hypothetical protein